MKMMVFFFFKQKTAYEIRKGDWSSDVCSSDLERLVHRCVEALHKTFITPIDRDSIHRLITRMDDVMDYVEAAAERIALYELTSMTPEVKDLADVLHRAAVQVELACRQMRDLKNPKRILELAI